MFDYETTLAGIEYKVRKLIEENEHLRREVESLNDSREALKEALRNKDIEINNLKEGTKVLKLRNALTEKGDSAEMKLKINQLIRTIDRSLALLDRAETCMEMQPAGEGADGCGSEADQQ